MAFRRNVNNTPISVDRENVGEVIHPRGLKDSLSTGRIQNGPKQAFGELKNVIHNQQNLLTPLKRGNLPTPKFITPFNKVNSNVKSNNSLKTSTTVKNTVIKKKQEKKVPKKDNKFVKDPKFDDILTVWAQNVALTDSEIDHIINGNHDLKLDVPLPKSSDVRFPDIWKDLEEPKMYYDDEILPDCIPELPDNGLDFDNKLFDQLLAF